MNVRRLATGAVTVLLLLLALRVRSGVVFALVVLIAIFVPMEKLFALHPGKTLRPRWRSDAVHHSIEEMDWLAASRLHPLDSVFTRAVTILPLYVLGFSRATFGGYLVFTAFVAIFIHANVRSASDRCAGSRPHRSSITGITRSSR